MYEEQGMDDEKPMWKAYMVRQTDMRGYSSERFGVREEYSDGATRDIHNEVFETREEAQLLASKFNLYARKGRTYDNTMKRWD
jgi:hypothetical protein